MLDNIKGALLSFNAVVALYIVLWAIGAFIIFICSIPNLDIMTKFWETFKSFKILHIIVAVLLIFFSVIQVMLPTTKQMALIYVVPKIVNNENLQKIPDNVLQLINGYLEELTENIGETKDEVVNGIIVSIEKDQLTPNIKNRASEILEEKK